mmetsp:Transcript_54275/g.74159  ORF Transcript_54275/g.74159 Transcript_54275/m.74159 type:complete len:104 (-) Transcript_54275:386-697(-)
MTALSSSLRQHETMLISAIGALPHFGYHPLLSPLSICLSFRTVRDSPWGSLCDPGPDGGQGNRRIGRDIFQVNDMALMLSYFVAGTVHGTIKTVARLLLHGTA